MWFALAFRGPDFLSFNDDCCPMSTSALDQLVEMLGQPLPDGYLNLLRDYPEVLKNVPRAIDNSDSEGTIEEVELIRDLECVLEINREARDGSVPDPEGVEHLWPDQLLVIGETGEGDYYCLDVDEPNPCVMQFNHMSVVFEVIAEDLQDFVQMLVEVMVEYDPDAPDDFDDDFDDDESSEHHQNADGESEAD